jgi:hypothetical protein
MTYQPPMILPPRGMMDRNAGDYAQSTLLIYLYVTFLDSLQNSYVPPTVTPPPSGARHSTRIGLRAHCQQVLNPPSLRSAFVFDATCANCAVARNSPHSRPGRGCIGPTSVLFTPSNITFFHWEFSSQSR